MTDEQLPLWSDGEMDALTSASAEEQAIEWAYPGFGHSDNELAPLAVPGQPPMREWSKGPIPNGLIGQEFAGLKLQLQGLEDRMRQDEAMNAQLKMGGVVHTNVSSGLVSTADIPPAVSISKYELGQLTSQVTRLIARYEELWDTASGIVNKDLLEG